MKDFTKNIDNKSIKTENSSSIVSLKERRNKIEKELRSIGDEVKSGISSLGSSFEVAEKIRYFKKIRTLGEKGLKLSNEYERILGSIQEAKRG